MTESTLISKSKAKAALNGQYPPGSLTIQEVIGLFEREPAAMTVERGARLCGISIPEMEYRLKTRATTVDTYDK